MNFNFDLFIDILWLGTLAGIIATVCLQKIKSITVFENYKILTILINIFIGYSFSRLFTNLSIKLSLCVGFITWIGAETIYDKIYSKKLLKDNPLNDTLPPKSSNEEIKKYKDSEDNPLDFELEENSFPEDNEEKTIEEKENESIET